MLSPSDPLVARLETSIDGALSIDGVPPSTTFDRLQYKTLSETKKRTTVTTGRVSATRDETVRRSEFAVEGSYGIKLFGSTYTDDDLVELCVNTVAHFLDNHAPPDPEEKQRSTSRSAVTVARYECVGGMVFGIAVVRLPPECYHCSRRHCEFLRFLEIGAPACCQCFHAKDPCRMCVDAPVRCAGCDDVLESWTETEGDGNLCEDCYS